MEARAAMTCATCGRTIDAHPDDPTRDVELYGTSGYAHFTPDPNDARRGFYTPADHEVTPHAA
jgi:hypothetical protein